MENGEKNRLMEKFSGDRYARLLGINPVRVDDGTAQVEMCVTRELCNFHGTTHGGALFSLADAALALASNSHGTASVALAVDINYSRATGPGEKLTAVASEETRSRRIGVYRIEICDGQGGIVALATGTCYFLPEKPESPY